MSQTGGSAGTTVVVGLFADVCDPALLDLAIESVLLLDAEFGRALEDGFETGL
jgi:hypothetical protein